MICKIDKKENPNFCFHTLLLRKRKTFTNSNLCVSGHSEPDEPLVEDGDLGPGDVEGLVLEEEVLHLVPNLRRILDKNALRYIAKIWPL